MRKRLLVVFTMRATLPSTALAQIPAAPVTDGYSSLPPFNRALFTCELTIETGKVRKSGPGRCRAKCVSSRQARGRA
jgi:hypothetical protein